MKIINKIAQQCSICGSITNTLLCEECSRFLIENRHTCSRCSSFIIMEDLKENGCRFCYNKKLFLSYVNAPFIYAGAISKLIKEMKYHKDLHKALILASFLTGFIPDKIIEADVVTYIPMRKQDEMKRGFNQSKVFAEKIAEKIHKPVLPLLSKARKTQRQAELGKIEREKNVSGSFKLNIKLNNQKVLIVDDVITTMSTVNCAAEMLKNGGAGEIYSFALARDSIYFS